MQLTKSFNLTVCATALMLVVTGCQIGPQRAVKIPGSKMNPGDEAFGGGRHMLPQPPVTETFTERPGGEQPPIHPPVGGGIFDNWTPNASILAAQTVYFDLDKSTFKKTELSKLADVANYLKSNPDKAVRVEGNCDERGTEEYNRSLGERRALSGREFLIQSGIDPQRLDTVTHGEDNPVEKGHNEAAWSKNRRDDFIVLTPPRQ